MTSTHSHASEAAAAALPLLAPDASGAGQPGSHADRTLPWSRRESDPPGGTVAIVEMVLGWLERARERRALVALSDHMLHDIGLSPADVENEVSKPFWQS